MYYVDKIEFTKIRKAKISYFFYIHMFISQRRYMEKDPNLEIKGCFYFSVEQAGGILTGFIVLKIGPGYELTSPLERRE